ncbi:MAG: hypothetical protein AB8F34_02790 [Akkermansiaceae bacterium]
MISKKRIITIFSAVAAGFLGQCSHPPAVTNAPHRTTPSASVPGIVTSSYPIKYTKRSGAGAIIGSIGGAVLGSRVGSGYAARMAGSAAGSWLGGVGGNAAEGSIRKRSAREITVKAGGKSYRTINQHNPPLNRGDRVRVITNVYGQALSIVPR